MAANIFTISNTYDQKSQVTQPTAIAIGGEGEGLSTLVRQRCDFIASIPMKGKISSLNASIAAAVVMYEALKQRRTLGR